LEGHQEAAPVPILRQVVHAEPQQPEVVQRPL